MIIQINQENLNAHKDAEGKYLRCAWPGMYPLFYIDIDGLTLCCECANKENEYSSPIADCDANWENESLFCDNCSKQIHSAYGDDNE